MVLVSWTPISAQPPQPQKFPLVWKKDGARFNAPLPLKKNTTGGSETEKPLDASRTKGFKLFHKYMKQSSLSERDGFQIFFYLIDANRQTLIGFLPCLLHAAGVLPHE